MRSAISQAIVRLHAEHYGKGATQAKTYAWDDLVVCVLRDVLTTGERTLVERGRPEAVHEVRRAFQASMADVFTATIERITGRTVLSTQSTVDTANGVGYEIFLLSPVARPRP
jgi:uncharacterized protein YbcI